MNDEQGKESTQKSFSVDSQNIPKQEEFPVLAVSVPPARGSTISMIDDEPSLFSVKTWVIIMVVVILVGSGIATSVIIMSKKDGDQTNNPFSVFTAAKPSDSSTSVAQKFAQTGDIMTVSFPNNIGDETTPIKVKVGRILKLLPEGGRSDIDLRACSDIGCHPMHAVTVENDEALVVLDLEFTNDSTDVARPFWAYFQGGLEARFKVGGTSQNVFSLKYANNQWFEESPSFYIESMKTMKITFWTRVPKETKIVELVYAKDFAEPILSIPMSFEPVLSAAMKADQELDKIAQNSPEFDLDRYVDSVRQSSIFADSFQSYRKQIDNRERLTCAFHGKSPGGEDVTNNKLTIDGEKFRWAQEIGSGNEKIVEGAVYDGRRNVYLYGTEINLAEGSVVEVVDVSCFKKTGIFPSIERLDKFHGPFEDVLCQSESKPDFSVPSYDERMVRSVENGNC